MDPIRMVSYVNLPRLMGRWFLIASMPTIFDRDAYNPIENLIWNEKEQNIDIHYTYNHGSYDGIVREMLQKAYIANPATNAEWKVQPIWPLRLSYVVFDLCPEYTYMVLAMKDRTHAWILSRQREIEETHYKKVIEDLGSSGFPVEKIKKFPQRNGFSNSKVSPEIVY